ncbi:short chain dehydrogenase [Burkholderia sp. D7]|nr:short chain dehydrogenase [Burkholderia sp. D7]
MIGVYSPKCKETPPVNTLTTPNVALVMGAGDSLGSALAKRFAREGMQVCVARRNAELLAAPGEQP